MVYVVVFTVILSKGYQAHDSLVATTMLKVKGSAHLGDDSTGDLVVYDEYDLVVPPLQPDSLFIATSFLTTPNQTRGICPGNLPMPNPDDGSGEICNCTKYQGDVAQCCEYGQHTENGMKLGYCYAGSLYCALAAWCPLESQTTTPPVLPQVRNWTVFDRVDLRYPNFDLTKSNTGSVLISGLNLFSVDQIIRYAGWHYENVSAKGMIVLSTFQYNCDLDKGIDKCDPDISWIRVDPTAPTAISKGFNYRYTIQYRDPETGTLYRDLWKVYGINIVYQIYGVGGKFDVMVLTITLGSGLALVGIATVICDIIMQYFLPNKESYIHEKYQKVAARFDQQQDSAGEYLVAAESKNMDSLIQNDYQTTTNGIGIEEQREGHRT